MVAWAKGVAAAAALARAIGVEREELLGQELDRVRVHLQKGGKQRMQWRRALRAESAGQPRAGEVAPCLAHLLLLLPLPQPLPLPTAAYYRRALPIFLRLKIMYSEMATVPLSSAAMTWQGEGW